jgi:hypothetical protein
VTREHQPPEHGRRTQQQQYHTLIEQAINHPPRTPAPDPEHQHFGGAQEQNEAKEQQDGRVGVCAGRGAQKGRGGENPRHEQQYERSRGRTEDAPARAPL